MKNILLFIIALSSSCLLIAQSESTTWMYNLEDEKPKNENQRSQKLIKIINNKRYDSIEDFLGKTIRLAIENGELTVYKNKACNNAFTTEEAIAHLELSSIDTIITFNPETFEEKFKIVKSRNILFPNKSTTYELVQEWNYNDESNQLEMSLKSINVYYFTLNKSKEVFENYLFSFKTNDLPSVTQAEVLNNPNVIWAKEIRYNGTFENQKLVDELLSKEHLQNNLVYDYFMDKKVENPEIKEIETSIDTIITFDPETFQEELKIVQSEFKKSDINSFRVVQDIYFDTETNQLQTKLFAIAPLYYYYDKEGNYKYTTPIFWIVYDDDFLKWLD